MKENAMLAVTRHAVTPLATNGKRRRRIASAGVGSMSGF